MRFRSIMAMAAAGVLLLGCATQQEIVQGKENLLAAAGFSIHPANTPQRIAELKTLKPHSFVVQQRNGQNVYLYPDPTICDCLYVGSEQAYQQYRRIAVQKQIADEQQQAAQMNADNWDWGPWGGGMGMGMMGGGMGF